MQEFINIANNINYKVELLDKKVDTLTKTHAQVLTEEWIIGEQVKSILKICNRKMQTLRDNGTLPFSRIDGTIYYRTSDVENLLNSNYNKR